MEKWEAMALLVHLYKVPVFSHKVAPVWLVLADGIVALNSDGGDDDLYDE